MEKRKDGLVDAKFKLRDVDLSKSLDNGEHDSRLAALQPRLMSIQQAYLRGRQRAAIVFEGWDAAGKGGTIRRLSSVMDPRSFRVWPIAAPSAVEANHHYLHRFWARLPGASEIVVFDRSWYGRVLVERVEGYATEAEWSRAYEEINAFERMLIDDGVRIVKIFLHISPEEQRKRFAERLREPLKRWKLSFEDFRNREKWGAYEEAITDMVRRTSTHVAPWTVIPANSKRYARIAALEHVVECLSEGVDLAPRPLDEDLLTRAERDLGLGRAELGVKA